MEGFFIEELRCYAAMIGRNVDQPTCITKLRCLSFELPA
jgi:hypothetical protein